jgi:predicted transcriptional regulator
MADVKEQVLAELKKAGKAVRPGDLATAAGLEKEAVSKALAALKKEGKVVSPKACFYQAS